MREAWSLLLVWALLLSAVGIVSSYEQAVVVKGIINCRGQRMPGMFVQLMEEDSFFDADDLMGSTNADFRGVFCVRGFTDEISTIEPFILIEHNCGYEGLNEKARFRSFSIQNIRLKLQSVYHHYVPSEFIVVGNRSHKIYHLGDIELLAPEAPVREYNRIGMLKPTGVQELDLRMKECIPVYIQYQKTMRLGAKAVDASQEVAHVLPQDSAESTTELPDMQPKPTPTSSPPSSQSAALSASAIQTETRADQHEVGENKYEYEKEQLEIREKEERQKLEEEEEENRRRQEVMDLRRKNEEERERERQLEQETAQKVEAVRIQELRRLEQEAQRKVEEEKRRIEYQKKVEEYWRREKERQLQEAARRNEERKRVEAEKRAKLDAEWAQQSQKSDLNQLLDESESIEVENNELNEDHGMDIQTMTTPDPCSAFYERQQKFALHHLDERLQHLRDPCSKIKRH